MNVGKGTRGKARHRSSTGCTDFRAGW